MTLYTIGSKRMKTFEENQPFWGDRFGAALCTDSHIIADNLDNNGEWIFVHEVELLTDSIDLDAHILDYKNPDNHYYFNGLESGDLTKFYNNLSIGEWNFRLFQSEPIQERLRKFKFLGYISKMMDIELLTLFDADQFEWKFCRKWDYSEILDEYDNLNDNKGYEFHNN